MAITKQPRVGPGKDWLGDFEAALLVWRAGILWSSRIGTKAGSPSRRGSAEHPANM